MVLYSTYLKKDNKLIIAVSYVEGGFTHILFITNPKYDSIQPGEIITGDYAIEIFSSEPIPYEEFESFVDELNKKFFLLTTKIKIKEWLSDIKDPYHLHTHRIDNLSIQIFKKPVIEITKSDDNHFTYIIRDFEA